MARPKKNLSLEEQLEAILVKIADTESALKELKAKKKELELQKRQSSLEELERLIAEKGLSLEEVIEKLS